jgi:MOSC domain-containing protein YiiM
MTLPRIGTPPVPGGDIGRIRAVLTGRAAPYTRSGSLSGIAKHARAGAIDVGPDGLAGDEQGDRRVHGGPDKAVHCYPWSHYAGWRQEIPGNALLAQPGAFGENFSVEGMDETSVCLGDRWACGSAAFEISQGRQPCWKLNDRFGTPDMSRRVQDSLRTGWYLRVLAPGAVAAGDTITLLARPYPDWPIARLLRAIHDRTCDPALLADILALPLPASWHRLFAGRFESGQVESWTARLDGPSA